MSDFIDFATIQVTAGNGGGGSSAMRKEKYIPLGGPWGGDGGRGGDIVLVASVNLSTLIDFTHTRRHRAEDGAKGSSNNCTGRSGRDTVIRVPVGTLVVDEPTGERLADLTKDGQTYVAAEGGRGGRGNSHFKTAMRQAPKLAERGLPGGDKRLKLELKLLADVGLVGFPNAGKSTLLAALSAARPRIASYPFTTLIPQLGVVRLGPEESFVLADLPGLVEGAHEGKGLGLRFLRHLERTRLLLFLLDGNLGAVALKKELKILEGELKAYHPGLAELPRLVAVSKADLPESAKAHKALVTVLKKRKIPCLLVSAAARQGLEELKREVFKRVSSSSQSLLERQAVEQPLHRVYRPAARFELRAAGEGWLLSGREVEKWVALTDFTNVEAVRKLKYVFEKIGVAQAMREAGVKPGDPVAVGNEEFIYAP
ncbi:MAG TPA: GTPase ObgE [bacterium]|jgi:GTP-binding protein|nr:GTPase ObgE [bacterium]